MNSPASPASSSDRFWRNVLVVLTGSAMAQAIPLLGSLVIARLYAPSEFGVFASWLGGASLLAVAITGRYEMALALEPDGEPRRVAACAVLATLITASMAMLLLLTIAWWTGIVQLPYPGLWFLGLFAGAMLAVAQSWQARAAADASYRKLSLVRIAQAVMVTGLQVAAGVFIPSANTLAIAHTAGIVCGIAVAAWLLPLSLSKPAGSTWTAAIAGFCSRHRRLPMLSLPADSLNTATSQLPLLIVTSRFGPDGSR